MAAVITSKKITLLPSDINYLTKQCNYTRIYTPHSHNSWWLVLGWVITKEDHLLLLLDHQNVYICI